MVEKFENDVTVATGNKSDIVILGEAPANNGWRKSGVAWYDENHNLLPSGVVLQRLLKLIDYTLQDTYFLEAIKCYPTNRKYLKECSNNCKKYLLEQLLIINPQIILTLGDVATRTLLNTKYSKYGDIVGKCYDYNGFEVIPIYHPSPISPLSYNGNVDIFENVIKGKVKTLRK
jgi:DNA polymerase